MIKAIQTEYNGYKFRSRLEARWAVFFDEAGIEYQYEAEGFENDDGDRYLPDFYLPDFDAFVEVKGSDDQLYKDIDRIIKFIGNGGIGRLIILGEIPNTDKYDPEKNLYYFTYLFDYSPYLLNKETVIGIGECVFIKDRYNGPDILSRRHFYRIYEKAPASISFSKYVDITGHVNCNVDYKYFGDRDAYDYDWNYPLLLFGEHFSFRRFKSYDKIPRSLDYYDCELFNDIDYFVYASWCFDKARQARFEYGETPKVRKENN